MMARFYLGNYKVGSLTVKVPITVAMQITVQPGSKLHCQLLANWQITLPVTVELGGKIAMPNTAQPGCESQSRLLSNLGVNCTANFCPTRVRIAPPITVQLVGKSH